MNNLSITAAEIDRLVRVTIWVACAVFVLIVAVSTQGFNTPLLTAAWRAISPTVLIAGGLFALFAKYAWKWPGVSIWMRRPVVNGVWFGTLTSDYKAAGDVTAPAVEIPIVFVIRQTYMTLSVQSFTPQQEGESRLEALIRNEKTDQARLSYVFELRKPYVSGGNVTAGAGELKLVADGTELRGHYWTDTPTHGSVTLKFLTPDTDGISCYADAARKWPEVRNKRIAPV